MPFMILLWQFSESYEDYQIIVKQGSTEIITERLWAVEPVQCKDATKGLRVTNFVVPLGFKSNSF